MKQTHTHSGNSVEFKTHFYILEYPHREKPGVNYHIFFYYDASAYDFYVEDGTVYSHGINAGTMTNNLLSAILPDSNEKEYLYHIQLQKTSENTLVLSGFNSGHFPVTTIGEFQKVIGAELSGDKQ